MKVAVAGAGAAGTMAAIWAAEAGARVTVFEGTRDGGRKILISGGGRCNILPGALDVSRFVTDSSPHSLRKMLRAWPLAEQVQWFERNLGLTLVEEPETGKLFPATNRARDVRDGLYRVLRERGGALMTGTRIENIRPDGEGWSLLSGAGRFTADRVVLATGGLSVPATGSDGAGLDWLRHLGHEVHPVYAALTPVTAPPSPWRALAGISLPVVLSAESPERRSRARGGFLFTHRGYSGPAVLDVSHVVVRARLEGQPAVLRVGWGGLEESDWREALKPFATRTVLTAVRTHIPERLAGVLLEQAGVSPDTPLAQLRREERSRVLSALTGTELPWDGDEGYRKAEVTGGGVALSEVNPVTMESRRCAGLHLCGEVLDVFGPIGGYNFAWAWATGRAAGLGAGQG